MQKTLLVLILAVVAVMAIDLDGDGFHSDNPVARFVDCCDTVLDGCEDPFMVNPGAYDFYGDEVVNNCDKDEYQNSNYCDRINNNLLYGIFTGPGTLESNTEFLVGAMDICAIVDDDDDPTWGFLRQENMVVSLADGKRAGYDPYPTTSGPSAMQVTAKQGFGRIGPFRNNLGAVVALSTGWATDTRDPSFANTLPPNTPASTGNDPASLPSVYRNAAATDDPYPPACGAISNNKPDPVFDSVRLSFVVRQPTNAEAYAVKAKLLTNDMAAYPPTVAQQCSLAKNYFIVLTNNTVAPNDKNIAKDRNGQSLTNLITDPAFWNNCDDYTAFPSNCDRSDIRLEFTDKLAASQWVSIGNRANRREEFRVDMILYQRLAANPDMVVLLDDWQIIQEARTQELTPHGYMRTSDIGLDHYRLPGHNSALVPIGPGSVTYEYKVTNWGPERASDITLAFTPPFGTRYASVTLTGSSTTCSVVQAALAPFQDNSFYKCKLGALDNLTSFTGTLTFTLINPVPGDSFKFRLTASSSSIDVDQSNNYKLAYAFAVPR